MDKNAIRKYAVWARTELIERVTQKAQQYGISESEIIDANADSINGKLLSATEKKQRQALIAKIKEEGFEQVMEEVAYTWFNRFTALRFMEVNNYLPSHTRVFTNEANEFKPQILADALSLELDGLNMEKVIELKDASRNEELYKYLIIVQCNVLNGILPRMFQKMADYTELLLPDNLLRTGSVLEQMITLIPEKDWTEQVQIVGWLYQYYNIEPKASVDAAVKNGKKVKKHEIPAKTQIFTPDWIVRYMVENSLGRIWDEGHPQTSNTNMWKYYVRVEQDEEQQSNLEKIFLNYAQISPEEIICIDPCSGSGHILCYMFDVLVQIYESYGYTAKEAAEKIVRYNIWGLDIDERASQLAYFSVMMKARQYGGRRFFSKNIQPHIYSITESNGIDMLLLNYFVNNDVRLKHEMELLLTKMKDAKEYGALIDVGNIDFEVLFERLRETENEISLYTNIIRDEIKPLIESAYAMSQKYNVVCTNPPYMGNGCMSDKLSEYVKENYFDSKTDLFSAFIERCIQMTKPEGLACLVTMQSWMFLSSFEKMRKKLLERYDITNIMHMENMVMGIAFGTAVSTFRNTRISGYKATYNYIKMKDIDEEAPCEFPVKGNRFAQISVDRFSAIPGSPIAYWISDKLVEAFDGKLLSDVAKPRQGLATGDNNRFLRLWHEVDFSKIGFGVSSREEADASGKKWFPCNKGGNYRKWYGNNDYVVNWERDGFEIRNLRDDKGKQKSRPQNMDYYFKEGMTWSTLTNGGFSMRYSPLGHMFETKGSVCFANDANILKYLLGFMNTPVVSAVLAFLSPTVDFHEGPLGKVPTIIDGEQKDRVTSLVDENIQIAMAEWDSFETSFGFKKSPLLPDKIGEGNKVEKCYSEWEKLCYERFVTMKNNEELLNSIFIDVYGLEGELVADVAEKDISVRIADKSRDVKALISYAVGCMFGRYSYNKEGIVFAYDAVEFSAGESTFIDGDNIIPICDDVYFEDDIVEKFVRFISDVYGEDYLEENLRFIADALGGQGTARDIIRNYFLNEFYDDHCATYSITGSGKRPIYWLFESGKKNSFKCLIYLHRYQNDTIARIRTDYVHELQSRYRTEIENLKQLVENVDSSERIKYKNRLKTVVEQEEELRIYEEKIHHLADQMISIDLDDGVKVNYAKFQDVLAKIK